MAGIKFVKQKIAQVSTAYDMTFTYTATVNDLTSVALETSEPSGYTFDFTVTQAFIDTQVTGKVHPNFRTFNLNMTGGASGTGYLYCKVYLNDVQIYTTSVSASTAYWFLNTYIYSIKAGDKVSAKIWADGTRTGTYYHNSYVITPLMAKSSRYMLKDLSWTVSAAVAPAMTSTKTSYGQDSCVLYGRYGMQIGATLVPSTSYTSNFPFMCNNEKNGAKDSTHALKNVWGFYSTTTQSSDANSYYNFFRCNASNQLNRVVAKYAPVHIQFKEVLGVST